MLYNKIVLNFIHQTLVCYDIFKDGIFSCVNCINIFHIECHRSLSFRIFLLDIVGSNAEGNTTWLLFFHI